MNNSQHTAPIADDAPPTFLQSWLNLTKRVYKWLALPIALLVFCMGDGWTAMRLAQDGYEQTAGAVTEFGCGKSGVVEYTYVDGRYPHHSVASNSGCRRYFPGETVPVYYSTRHPEMSVINATPGKIFRNALKVAFLAALLMPPFGALVGTIKAWRN